MKTKFLSAIIITATIGCLSYSASAQQLYRDQMNNGTGWGVNASGSDYAYAFNYDYSANGIPEAPHTQVGDDATRGVQLEANLTTGTVNYFTLYPMGQAFSGSWQLRFDAWMNYGTGGTTEFMGGGIGYDSVSADLVSGAQAITTGDGGSSADWRALKSAPPNPAFYIPASGMTGGTQNAQDAYYADFLPSVNGSVAGAPGFQWITWEFDVVDNNVSIYVEKPNGDRLEIVSYDKTDTSDGSSGATTDGNISLYYADFFTSVASPAGSTYGLIDNVVVSQIPEPSTFALSLLGGFGMMLVFRRRK